MSRERDERILESLSRKAQDPGIPAAEQRAFRAKADEVRRRLDRAGTSKGLGDEPSTRANFDASQQQRHDARTGGPKPSARAKPSARRKAASTHQPPRESLSPESWWLGALVSAGLMAVGAGLLFRYSPGLLVVVLLIGLGAGVLWADRRGL